MIINEYCKFISEFLNAEVGMPIAELNNHGNPLISQIKVQTKEEISNSEIENPNSEIKKSIYLGDNLSTMAENEIAKHTKAIYKSMKNKEASWIHKFKEISIEVLIIVFAVTISIWFHNWSDSLHERKEEKEFLTGLKMDIYGDLDNINNSLRFYQFALNGDRYFIKAGSGGPVSKDSLNKYIGIFFSTTDLEPHTSRYEGLKGGNKFTIIENKDLLNDIIALHESTLTRINMLNNYYHDDIGNKMIPFISARIQFNPDGTIKNEKELENSSEMRFLLNYFQSYIRANVLQAHALGITKCKEVIKKIDKELDK